MDKEKYSSERPLLLWGAANAGEGFISIISSTYLSYFLTDVALIPLNISTVVMLVTSVAAFIMSTVTGGIIASVKPMRWGRLRSWLLVGPPVAVTFFTLHFISVPNHPILSAVIISIGYIVGISAWNFAFASNISLTNLLAKGQRDRNIYNSQRMMGSNLGRLMGNYLTPIIVAFLCPIIGERASYPILVLIAGVFYITTELIHFKIAKGAEENFSAHEYSAEVKEDTLNLKEIFKTLSTNAQLLVTVLIDLSSNMAALALPSMAVYYYKYVFEAPSMIATHMLAIGLAGFAGSTFVRMFGKNVKSYRNYLLCVYLVISLCLVCTRFASKNVYAFLVLNIFIHALTGTTQPFEMNLYQDNVIYSEWKTGVNANSLIMGLGELPVRIASILKGLLLSFALASAGYVAGAQPTEVLKNALANAYAFIPACIPIIGFVLLKFAYKLTPEKICKMREEISARNNKTA